MSLGVAFALTLEQARVLLDLGDDESREAWLEELEEVEDGDWFQYDKAWDELHRCLGDGRLVIQAGPPLAHAVFGSQPLTEHEESPWFAGYLPSHEVPVVATNLGEVGRDWLRERFDALGSTDYATYGGPLDDELFEYVWACLEGLREFYALLVEGRAHMVFSVDA